MMHCGYKEMKMDSNNTQVGCGASPVIHPNIVPNQYLPKFEMLFVLVVNTQATRSN